MQVWIVGQGQLATELLKGLRVDGTVAAWPGADCARGQPSVVVNAGSGRELDAVVAYGRASQSPLIELSTGSALEGQDMGFAVVVCPNTNILMLKFMSMVQRSGHLFNNHQVRLTESHQAQKTSVPGTAVSLAQALGVPVDAVESVRSVPAQRERLQVPQAHLARHAVHEVVIEDGLCSVRLESRVYGEAPYAHGVGQIVAAVLAHPLQPRCYNVMEFVEQGWL